MRKLIDEDSNILSQGFNSNWIIRIKKNILSHGYSYPPLIFSLISYIALYCIQKEVQADNAGLYLFVQYSMLAILPALIVFELRPIKLVHDILWSWLFSNALLYIFFGLGTIIILMSGLGLINTFAFLVHLVVALLISSRLVGLSLVVIISIGIVIFCKAFSEVLGHVITYEMSIPFLIGYWMLLLSSVYISFLRYHYNQQLMKPRSGKFWKKYVSRREREKAYEAAEDMRAVECGEEMSFQENEHNI